MKKVILTIIFLVTFLTVYSQTIDDGNYNVLADNNNYECIIQNNTFTLDGKDLPYTIIDDVFTADNFSWRIEFTDIGFNLYLSREELMKHMSDEEILQIGDAIDMILDIPSMEFTKK